MSVSIIDDIKEDGVGCRWDAMSVRTLDGNKESWWGKGIYKKCFFNTIETKIGMSLKLVVLLKLIT